MKSASLEVVAFLQPFGCQISTGDQEFVVSAIDMEQGKIALSDQVNPSWRDWVYPDTVNLVPMKPFDRITASSKEVIDIISSSMNISSLRFVAFDAEAKVVVYEDILDKHIELFKFGKEYISIHATASLYLKGYDVLGLTQ